MEGTLESLFLPGPPAFTCSTPLQRVSGIVRLVQWLEDNSVLNIEIQQPILLQHTTDARVSVQDTNWAFVHIMPHLPSPCSKVCLEGWSVC